MAERFDQLDPKHVAFIEAQHLFFVGTASVDSFINVSPNGLDTLRVLGPNRIVWLNLTGSGNETSSHVQRDGRMTLMFCSFDRQPLILRVYGRAQVIHPQDAQWPGLIDAFDTLPGARQCFDMQIELILTSCGYAVPHYELKGERETLTNWAHKKGQAGIEAYWAQTNARALDGSEIKR